MPFSARLVGLMSLFGTLALPSQAFSQKPPRIAAVGAHYAASDGFSGTITVAHGDKVVSHRGYGLADRAHRTPFTPHTRFNIGSVSKQFTAAAVLLLQQDGKLHTSESLATSLPDVNLPSAWSALTVRQLLSHTSGLKDYAH